MLFRSKIIYATGQSSSRQKPVPLPELVIPTESTQLGRSSDQTPPIESSLSTSAPPVLPNHYNSNQDKRNENGQAYYHQSVRRPIQQTQPYFTGRVVEIPSSGSSHKPLASYYDIPKSSHNHLQAGVSNKDTLPVSVGGMSTGRRLREDDSILASILNYFTG